MRSFTVYVERDIVIECVSDKEAAEVAKLIDDRIDAALASVNARAQDRYRRVSCHRGRAHKCVYDHEVGQA